MHDCLNSTSNYSAGVSQINVGSKTSSIAESGVKKSNAIHIMAIGLPVMATIISEV